MKKRKSLLFLLACALILSACSNSNETANGSNGNEGKGNVQTSNKDAAAVTDKDAATDTDKGAAADTDPYKMPEATDVSFVLRVNPDLKLPEGDTVENNVFTRYIAEQTNIHFKLLWYASNTDYDQKSKLSIASNDLPDAMVVDEKQYRAMAEGGQLEDLSEVYSKFGSDQLKAYYNSTDGRALQQATIGGKLMALPNIVPQADTYVLTWMRKDWLDKLGLPEPKTLEDVEAITKAFIERDPDGNGKPDTIGLTGNNTSITQWYGNDFRAIFNYYNAHPGTWYKNDSGKLVYGSTTPEAKKALLKAQELYKNGLVDKEFAVRKDPMEPVKDGKVGVFFQAWWVPFSLADMMKSHPEADWKAYAIPGVNGKVNVTHIATSNGFLVVKKGFKHPEALVKYLNFQTRFGKSPTEEDKKIDHTLYVSVLPLSLNIDYIDTVSQKHDMITKALKGEISQDKLTPEMKGHYERWQRVLASKGHPDPADWGAPYSYIYGAGAIPQKADENAVDPAFTATTPAMDKKWSNLQKLEDETFFQIVLGEKPIEAFDQYVADWKAQGGDEITQEIEAELSK
ncbi:extracellular solute-binding protein [Paenibacillus sp. R14(2021)]|uniref:extracellular solute-binding protein n=1 Tax=Paenibacillus sp. R14(2021) TaxID=2859228 RepID=UPI001C6135E1|nr:extracellular solute-binding protein [Paenibacillus sp. R14(2021)]